MKRNLRWILLFACLLAFILAPAFYAPGRSQGNDIAQVAFIDVGQGDAILLQDPHGYDVLIDGGPVAAGAAVVAFLRSRGLGAGNPLEVVLNTHADADHAGGLIAVLQAADIPIGSLYYNGYEGTTVTWSNFKAAAAARGLTPQPAQFPAEYTWGDFRAYILNPAPGLSTPAPNPASVTARIDYIDTRFLFTGDIDMTVEATVVARQTPVAAQVLKVAHHGSKYSSSTAFLSAVSPDQGVIMVGPNTYGHPADETVARLGAQGVRVWRTDWDGTILFLTDGTSVAFPGGSIVKVYLPAIVR